MGTFNAESYWQNRLARTPGLEGVGFVGLGPFYNYWLYAVQRRVFLRQVKTIGLNWTETDVLDVGSGTGFYVRLWKSLGVRSITATDITEVAVRRLGKEFRGVECLKLDIGDAIPDELSRRRYGIVSAFGVLYHVLDDERYRRALRNIHHLLHSGGVLIFSENFVHGHSVRATHQVSRSLSQIERALRDTGFSVKSRVPMFFIMNVPVDIRNPLIRTAWKVISFAVARLKVLGAILGALEYAVQIALSSWVTEGPSTELMICQKKR